METTPTNKTLDTLRWIGFVPLAILAAWLAWFTFTVLGIFSFVRFGVDPETFQAKLSVVTTGHAATGAAFVYVGAKIAPYHRIIVAFVLGGIGIIVAGFLLFPAVMARDWWAVWGGLFVAIGAGVVVYAVHVGETDIG